MEWAFEREWVHYAEVSEHNDPTCWLFTFLDFEGAACKREIGVVLAAQEGKNSKLGILDSTIKLKVFKGASIKERILLSAVTMEITVE